MKKRKITAVLLTGVIRLVLLAGCGNAANNTKTKDDADSKVLSMKDLSFQMMKHL